MFRAKFEVVGVEKPAEDSRILRLRATTSTGGDNRDWSKYTPDGELRMTVTNEAAFEKIDGLKQGELFYIGLSKVAG